MPVRKAKGGALISEGSYGCVFSPTLPCKRGARVADVPASMGDALGPAARVKFATANLDAAPLLTKMFGDDRDFHLEWDNARLIAEVDPEQRYFMFAIKQCRVTRNVVAKERPGITSPKMRCSILNDDATKKEYPVVTMPDGGSPLHRWLQSKRDNVTLAQLVDMLIPSIRGVQLLNRHGIIHQDLKGNNLVVDAKNQVKIIDFGLMTTYDALFDRSRNPIAYKKYWLLPPEMRVVRWLEQRRTSGNATRPSGFKRPSRAPKDIVDELIDVEKDELTFTFADGDRASLNGIYDSFNPDHGAYRKDMLRVYRRLAKAASPEAAVRPYASRVDIYSIGLILMWVAQYSHEWGANTAASKAALDGYKTFVADMVNPDPLRRSSTAKALKAALAWRAKHA
jgi:serine/threonine protein kinase